MSKWEALGILMCLAFLNYMDRQLLFPLQPMIASSLGLNNAQLGGLSTGFHIVYACAAPLVGFLSDRMTRKRILIITLVAWSFLTAGSGLCTGFASLLVLRSLTGLGEGGYFPTAVSLIGDYFKNNRGMAIALHGVCTTLGGGAGLALGGVLGEYFEKNPPTFLGPAFSGPGTGWRAPFLLVVIPGLLLAIYMALRFVEPTRGGADEGPAKSDVTTREESHEGFGRTGLITVVLISLGACGAAFAMAALTTFLPKYLVDVRGMSAAEAGAKTGFFFLITIPGQLFGGALSDWLARRVRGARPLLMGLPYLLVAPAVFGISAVESVTVALVGYGLTMLARGFAEPNIYGTIIDAVPARGRGTAQGCLLAATFAGAASGSWICGLIIDAVARSSGSVATGYGVAMTTLAAATAVGGGVGIALGGWLKLRKPAAA